MEADDIGTYMTGQKICYAFVTHGMFLVFLFVLEYCRYSIPKFAQYLFHGVNFVITFVVFTLDHHQLFYTGYRGIVENGQLIIEKEYGFMHTVVLVMIGIYIMAYLTVTVVFTIKNIRKRRNYVWRLLLAILIPCAAYIVPKMVGFSNEIQNIAFAAFLIIIMYMIYRNNLYDVDNIAARLSIESMEEAFVVVDNKYCFMGCNRKAERLFPELKSIELDSDIRLQAASFVDYLDGKNDEYRDGDTIYGASVRTVSEGKTETD